MVTLLFCSIDGRAQNANNGNTEQKKPFFSTLRLEARADFDARSTTTLELPLQSDIISSVAHYGFQGKYFNLHMGGNLTDKFSYYFRQRIIANEGSSRFFDNTDFLYLNYQANRNFSFRFGKDALAVGGYEYDAAPIDVFFNGYYWDNFYCFQIATSAAYTTDDGNHTVRLQLANSPYVHYGGADASLFSYNLLWNGSFGHFKTLYSASVFERAPLGLLLNEGIVAYVALGNMLTFDKFNIYVDFIGQAASPHFLYETDEDYGMCYSVISRADFKLNDSWTLFAKGAYTRNTSEDELLYFHNHGINWNELTLPDQEECYGGLGVFFRPEGYRDIRFHAFIATGMHNYAGIDYGFNDRRIQVEESFVRFNAGVSWNINFLKAFKK